MLLLTSTPLHTQPPPTIDKSGWKNLDRREKTNIVHIIENHKMCFRNGTNIQSTIMEQTPNQRCTLFLIKADDQISQIFSQKLHTRSEISASFLFKQL